MVFLPIQYFRTRSARPQCAALVVVVLACAFGLSGCCTSVTCANKKSGSDGVRIGAKKLKAGLVDNDSVSSPKGDRDDWKVIEVANPGKLSVQLHWDRPKARLSLVVFDVMGAKIQEGRRSGSADQRSVIAVEEPGPYYIRVRAKTRKDESTYALRVLYKEDQTGPLCVDCTIGDRKCFGTDQYLICTELKEGCTAWSNAVKCPESAPCSGGKCSGCQNACETGQRRCAGSDGFEICRQNNNGCFSWSASQLCGRGKSCKDGRCKRRRTGKKPKKPAKPAAKPKLFAKARIISVYRSRGRWKLHIELGEDAASIRPGAVGQVLQGGSGKGVSGGQIKITKVNGRFAVAVTKLEKLGKNRWVRIRLATGK